MGWTPPQKWLVFEGGCPLKWPLRQIHCGMRDSWRKKNNIGGSITIFGLVESLLLGMFSLFADCFLYLRIELSKFLHILEN